MPTAGACYCWANDHALGHEGHCCFVREDKDRKINNGFREDSDVCHIPERALGVRETTSTDA
jgi:hypothetical protein